MMITLPQWELVLCFVAGAAFGAASLLLVACSAVGAVSPLRRTRNACPYCSSMANQVDRMVASMADMRERLGRALATCSELRIEQQRRERDDWEREAVA